MVGIHYKGHFVLRKPLLRWKLQERNCFWKEVRFSAQWSARTEPCCAPYTAWRCWQLWLWRRVPFMWCYISTLYSVRVNLLVYWMPGTCGDCVDGQRKKETETWKLLSTTYLSSMGSGWMAPLKPWMLKQVVNTVTLMLKGNVDEGEENAHSTGSRKKGEEDGITENRNR